MNFPRELYVRLEKDNDGSIFVKAELSINEFDEQGPLALYKLSAVGKLKIQRKVVS